MTFTQQQSFLPKPYVQRQVLTGIKFSLLLFVNKNRSLFSSNSEIHYKNTRFNHNLHFPSTNLTLVQKGVLYSGSKIYNHLPLYIKCYPKMLSNSNPHQGVILWNIYFIDWMYIIN